MATTFPYARYACPCADVNNTSLPSKRSSRIVDDENNNDDDANDGHTFDPHHLRANFSLFPLDQLLFCDECHQTRCPKCLGEEMLYWYCPNCLFEVPSSSVKGDGNRCTRHCYDCPSCTAPLAVTAVGQHSDGLLRPDGSSSYEAFILHCQYCFWSSYDIGVTFPKNTKIPEQLHRMWKKRNMSTEDSNAQAKSSLPSHESVFATLSSFYKDQLRDSGDTASGFPSSPYSSPANLQRIMTLYGGLSTHTSKLAQQKPQPMREAGNRAEGLSTFTAESTPGDPEVLQKMRTLGWEGTLSEEQRLQAPANHNARFTSDLWPVATKLRVRRGKRCRTCRQFLARPETKTGSMRYKIRLLAINYILRLSIRPLASAPTQTSAFHMKPEPVETPMLPPHQTQHYILTVRNPIFEAIKVTLSTPAMTPGKIKTKVTILCPSFTVGAAGDWVDEALSESTISVDGDGSRKAAMASLTGSTDAERQPEAGKIWERTRSSTSVIIEVVPGALVTAQQDSAQDGEKQHLDEDEDILEIPIHLRADWEAPPPHTYDREKAEKQPYELAYWCVLGVGRIAPG